MHRNKTRLPIITVIILQIIGGPGQYNKKFKKAKGTKLREEDRKLLLFTSDKII